MNSSTFTIQMEIVALLMSLVGSSSSDSGVRRVISISSYGGGIYASRLAFVAIMMVVEQHTSHYCKLNRNVGPGSFERSNWATGKE